MMNLIPYCVTDIINFSLSISDLHLGRFDFLVDSSSAISYCLGSSLLELGEQIVLHFTNDVQAWAAAAVP